jgi:hypothetical protein
VKYSEKKFIALPLLSFSAYPPETLCTRNKPDKAWPRQRRSIAKTTADDQEKENGLPEQAMFQATT